MPMKIEEKSFENLKYIIRYPDDYDCSKVYPIIIFMHGAGTRGDDLNVLYATPFFSITDTYKHFPFITVAPLCNRNTWFDIYESVIRLTKNIYNARFTDKKRFYAIGASMGGYAVWQMAMSCPTLFAAIVPICGGGMYWNAERLKNVSVWAFHGDSDTVVHMSESKKMIDAVASCGGCARLTVYENCDHNAWTQTYSNPDVFKWLLDNTSKNTYAISDKFNDSNIYG